jgi:hypothetical protein
MQQFLKLYDSSGVNVETINQTFILLSETITWKSVGKTTDANFGLMFSLMIIVVSTLYFVDVNGHSVF